MSTCYSGVDFVAAASIELEYSPVDPEQVVAGSPIVGAADLGSLGESEYGVWEHSIGASSDVEVDEVFVVLFGAATVEFDDGTVITLGPGSVGRLREGQATVWTVTETLRKVYIA
ncbi:MAG: cupin domain-containing protein [Terrimesophilobacter sp.]